MTRVIAAFISAIITIACAYLAAQAFQANDVNLGLALIVAALGWFILASRAVLRLAE